MEMDGMVECNYCQPACRRETRLKRYVRISEKDAADGVTGALQKSSRDRALRHIKGEDEVHGHRLS